MNTDNIRRMAKSLMLYADVIDRTTIKHMAKGLILYADVIDHSTDREQINQAMQHISNIADEIQKEVLK